MSVSPVLLLVILFHKPVLKSFLPFLHEDHKLDAHAIHTTLLAQWATQIHAERFGTRN
jgi:hypothetical protein